MRPMGDAERYNLSAQYELGRGATPELAAQRLQQRFGWLSPGQAAEYVGAAMDALDRAAALNTADGSAMIGSEPRPGEAPGGIVNIDALVTIRAPGRDPEYRTVRIQASPDETVDEVRARIGAVIDDWNSRYGSDGRTGEFELTSVY